MSCKTKKLNIIQVALLYALIVVLFWLDGSPISLVGYSMIGICSIFNPLLSLSMLGASNYLPAVLGVSPFSLSLGIALIVMLLRGFLHKPARSRVVDVRMLVLLPLIVFWSVISGSIQNDMSFTSSMVTSFIAYVVISFFLNKFEHRNKAIDYLMAGVGVGVILAIFINFGISGFESSHFARLAIGERADPNSTGLLLAIFSVYSFVQFTNKINDGLRKVVPHILMLLLGAWGLLLTQSRGSVLCVCLVIMVYILFTKKKGLGDRGLITVIALCFFVTVVLALTGDKVLGMLWDALYEFIFRVQNTASVDGERLYLLQKSFESFFENPLFGVSLSEFEFFAGHIPHNTFSDYMVTNGIVGIMFFVIMFAVPIISYRPSRRAYELYIAYFCYFVCFLNTLFYSASNEKMLVVLLAILIHLVEVDAESKHRLKIKNTEN